MPKNKSFSLSSALIDIIEVLFICGVVFFMVWLFLAELVEVTGESMEPTLQNKEQVLIEKVTLGFGEIQRGDIIVFESPETKNKYLIKRVIGLPNETLEIKQGQIYINDKNLNEPYLNNQSTIGKETIKENTAVKLNENSYVLLGDNRENSTDSRDFGPISKDKILGKAVLVYYPISNLRIIDHVDLFLSFGVVNKLNNSAYF